MSRAVDQELDRLFAEAERSKTCLAAPSERTARLLNQRARAGHVVRPRRSLFARTAYWNALRPDEQALHIVRGLQKLNPSWTFCHESAALVWGLPLTYRRMDAVHVVNTRAMRRSGGNVIWHVIEGDSETFVEGVRVTSLERTLFDCLRSSTFAEGLPLADRGLALLNSGPQRLQDAFARFGKGCANISRAIGTLSYANARSESWAESVARALMITQGFALPDLQVELPRPLESDRSYRVDFFWQHASGRSVIGEVDGMIKYTRDAAQRGQTAIRALADEQHREAQLTMYRMPILRLSYQDLINTKRFVEKLTAYGIPRDPHVADAIKRLGAKSPRTALLYQEMRIPKEIIEQFIAS